MFPDDPDPHEPIGQSEQFEQIEMLDENEPVFTHIHEDFLLLHIFLLVQNGSYERANVLVQVLMNLHPFRPRTLLRLYEAVLSYLMSNYRRTIALLEELDVLDPTDHLKPEKKSQAQRLRQYLKLRSYHELLETDKAEEALRLYMESPMLPIGTLPGEEEGE